MPSLSTTPSGAATLQGHGLVVADGALGRAMARLLLEQAPALTPALTGRTGANETPAMCPLLILTLTGRTFCQPVAISPAHF